MAPIMAVILRESGVSSNAAARGIADDIKRSGITTVRGLADELSPGAFGLLGVTRGIRPPVARLLNRLSNTTHTN
jgi:hypothetical protein